MKSDFFIDRPVFSTVLSVVIVIVGLLGLVMLPVDQYPRIVPPVVKISASYPGASAQTVTQAVATPIEQELNGTPGMLYMESTSSNSGGFSATVTFDIDTDADLAAVEIQNRVNSGHNVILDIDVKGGVNVKRQFGSDAISIFIAPPSIDELRNRLRGRGSDSEEEIEQRVGRAAFELGFQGDYDHVVVNNTLPEAIGEVESLISGFINN